jgi:MmyB-like transcription regulator ligand binding domain
MERGHLRGVSDTVLRSLARALHMNAVETQHLFDLARASSAGARTSRIEPRPRLPNRAAQLIDAMPDLPVVALGRLSDVLGANELGRALFPHLFPDDGEPLNHTRYLFLDDRAREFYVDWEHDARHVVSVLRLEAGRHTADQSIATLVDELAAGSPQFRTWWAGHTVDVHTDGTKRIRHPVVGELTVAYERLALASTPDVHLTGYLTDPGTPSAHALDLLRDHCRGTGTAPSTRTATAPSFVADVEPEPMPPHRFPALHETGRTQP